MWTAMFGFKILVCLHFNSKTESNGLESPRDRDIFTEYTEPVKNYWKDEKM